MVSKKPRMSIRGFFVGGVVGCFARAGRAGFFGNRERRCECGTEVEVAFFGKRERRWECFGNRAWCWVWGAEA